MTGQDLVGSFLWAVVEIPRVCGGVASALLWDKNKKMSGYWDYIQYPTNGYSGKKNSYGKWQRQKFRRVKASY